MSPYSVCRDALCFVWQANVSSALGLTNSGRTLAVEVVKCVIVVTGFDKVYCFDYIIEVNKFTWHDGIWELSNASVG